MRHESPNLGAMEAVVSPCNGRDIMVTCRAQSWTSLLEGEDYGDL